MIPEEAISLHETVGEVIERRLGDYVHDELPQYGQDRTDRFLGMLYVCVLLVTTALAAFFLGRESLRYYPDPGVPQTTVEQPEIHIFIPSASPVETAPWPALD